VLAAVLASLGEVAVMLCEPEGRVVKVSVATPEVSGAVPRGVAPSENCTLPPRVLGVTVALKITGCCGSDGLGEEANFTVEPAFTFWGKGADVLPALVSSPL
jgi:hypothetical protein